MSPCIVFLEPRINQHHHYHHHNNDNNDNNSEDDDDNDKSKANQLTSLWNSQLPMVKMAIPYKQDKGLTWELVLKNQWKH